MPGNGGDAAARRDDDVFGVQNGGRGAVDGDAPPARQAPGAGEAGHAVLLEEPRDAMRELADDALLAFHHLAEIERYARSHDAVSREPVACFGETLARLEQRFRRDAADPQARPAEGGLLLDAGHFEPELCAADGGDVAAGAGADHDEVECLSVHEFRPPAAFGRGFRCNP
jgi:hypothetical protein